MISRVIIEQKIHDLEVAISHQEELLKSQKEILNGLKGLLATELNKVAVVAKPVESSSAGRNSMVDLTGSQPQPNVIAPSNSTINNAAQDGFNRVVSLPAKKKGPSEMPPASPETLPVFTATPSVKLKPFTISIPAVHAALNYGRRRRATEKVNQFCVALPHFAPTSSTSANNSVTSSSGQKRKAPHDDPPDPSLHAPALDLQPKKRSSNDPLPSLLHMAVKEMLSHLQTRSAYQERLEAVKELFTINNVDGKRIRQFLEQGGKELLVQWLAALDQEQGADKSLSTYIEYSVVILQSAIWTNELVAQTRIDKILRRLFKKYSSDPEIFTTNLSNLVREAWGRFRISYSAHKAELEGSKEGSGEEEEGKSRWTIVKEEKE